jgi:hypothetical protein
MKVTINVAVIKDVDRLHQHLKNCINMFTLHP